MPFVKQDYIIESKEKTSNVNNSIILEALIMSNKKANQEKIKKLAESNKTGYEYLKEQGKSEKEINQYVSALEEIHNLLLDSDLQKALDTIVTNNADLIPHIYAELKKVKKDPEFNNISIWDVFEIKEIGQPAPKSKAALILERAIKRQEKNRIKREEEKKKKTTAKTREKLPAISNTVILNDAINHVITQEPIKETNNEGIISRMYKTNQGTKTNPLPVYFTINYKGDDIKLSKRSNAYDNAIENAICSIVLNLELENNNNFVPFSITPDEIFRVMIGTQNKNTKPTLEQKKRVIEALDKARFTEVTADLSEEIQKHNLYINDERIINGQIKPYRLNATPAILKTEKGRIIEGYKINEEPILLTYNKMKATEKNKNGHVIFLPLELLNTEDNEGNTIEIKNYLLDRIVYMNNDSKASKRILFETMYKNGIEEPKIRIKRENTRIDKTKSKEKSEETYQANIRKAKAKDRARVFKILEKWKEKKFILDYSQVNQGRAIIGVDIIINPNAPQLNKQ